MVPHNRLLLEGLLEYPDNLGSSLELLLNKIECRREEGVKNNDLTPPLFCMS